MPAAGDSAATPSAEPPLTPGMAVRERGEPLALKFAWAIVAVAAAVSIGLVVAQVGWDWPFAPTRRTTTTQTLDSADETVELTDVQVDDGGAREALFRTVAGIAALTAGLLAWGRLEQSRRQHDLDRKAAARAVEAQELATRAQVATERGQVTQRFTTAVEQLGHADPSVRLGALYALEALAHDSPTDRVTICEVVCAYPRHHSVCRTPDGQVILVDNGEGKQVPDKVTGTDEDYGAAIAIALRLPLDWDLPVRNLDGTVHAAAGFADRTIPPVSLRRTTFSGDANFRNATFSGDTDFGDATFSGDANFPYATFSGDANFNGAAFSGDADISNARFSGDANFGDATFSGDTDFGDATFIGVADFSRAAFIGVADFSRAAFFGDANIHEATFSGDADFSGVAFIGDAHFRNARFSGDADFRYARFSGPAHFVRATFSRPADFRGAAFAKGARLPTGVNPGEAFEQRGGTASPWYNRPQPPDNDRAARSDGGDTRWPPPGRLPPSASPPSS